jgi:flagellar protein FlaG
MQNNASVTPISASVVSPVSSASASNGFQNTQQKDSGPDAGRYRLVIEEGPSGAFVYKTMDRLTGEVVRQFPREKVVEMQSSASYDAGSVIDTAV